VLGGAAAAQTERSPRLALSTSGTRELPAEKFNQFFDQVFLLAEGKSSEGKTVAELLRKYGLNYRLPESGRTALKDLLSGRPGEVASGECGACGVCGVCTLCGELDAASAAVAAAALHALGLTAPTGPEG
jgi:hypothetical protein